LIFNQIILFFFRASSVKTRGAINKNLTKGQKMIDEGNNNASNYGNHCWMYLVTALVPSETACLASSPGRMSLTAD